MEAHKQGREMVPVCNKDAVSAIRRRVNVMTDNDAVHLAKAANIVKRDMFKCSFNAKCQFHSWY